MKKKIESIIDCNSGLLGDDLGSGLYECNSRSPESCNYARRTSMNSLRTGYHCGLAFDKHWNEHNKTMNKYGGLKKEDD